MNNSEPLKLLKCTRRDPAIAVRFDESIGLGPYEDRFSMQHVYGLGLKSQGMDFSSGPQVFKDKYGGLHEIPFGHFIVQEAGQIKILTETCFQEEFKLCS